MPRLNNRISSSVFFLFGRDPDTGEIDGPLGSGVIIGAPRTDGGGRMDVMRHAYAVSCKHVVRAGASIIRVNNTDQGSRFIEFDPAEWVPHEDDDDLCAVDITERLVPSDLARCIPNSWLAGKSFIVNYGVNIGEDGFMLGLFADVTGANRNAVTARFGNVSLLAFDDVLIPDGHGGERPMHLFDLKSRPGYSGSPVFIYRTPSADLREVDRPPLPPEPATNPRGVGIVEPRDYQAWRHAHENTFIKLLGIHTGQFKDRVKVELIAKHSAEGSKVVEEGDTIYLPNSVATVAPAWRVQGLLHQENFRDQRVARELADRREGRTMISLEKATVDPIAFLGSSPAV